MFKVEVAWFASYWLFRQTIVVPGRLFEFGAKGLGLGYRVVCLTAFRAPGAGDFEPSDSSPKWQIANTTWRGRVVG